MLAFGTVKLKGIDEIFDQFTGMTRSKLSHLYAGDIEAEARFEIAVAAGEKGDFVHRQIAEASRGLFAFRLGGEHDASDKIGVGAEQRELFIGLGARHDFAHRGVEGIDAGKGSPGGGALGDPGRVLEDGSEHAREIHSG